MNSLNQLLRRGVVVALAGALAVPALAVVASPAAVAVPTVAAATEVVNAATKANNKAAADVKRTEAARKSAASRARSSEKSLKRANSTYKSASKAYTKAKSKAKKADKRADATHKRSDRRAADKALTAKKRAASKLRTARANVRKARAVDAKREAAYSRAAASAKRARVAYSATKAKLAKAKAVLAEAKRRPKPKPTSTPTPTSKPTSKPTVKPTPTPTPTPTVKPTPTPTPTPTVKPTPTPTPTPTVKPTPTPEPTQPATTGRPTESNTGLPSGTKLTVHKGDLYVTKAGTVIDGLDVRGFIRVKADNVVIKNSIVRGRDIGAQNMHLIQMSTGFKNLVVKDTTLASDTLSPYIKGIVGWNFTLDRVRIHKVVDQVSIIGDNVTIKNSLLHGNLFYEQDPNYNGTPTHDDNIQVSIGTNLKFINNVMKDTTNAAIMVTQDRGHVSNMLVEDNFMDGGACTVNLAEKKYGPLQGITFRNNRFGVSQTIDHCAIIKKTTTTITSEGNTFTDGRTFFIKRG